MRVRHVVGNGGVAQCVAAIVCCGKVTGTVRAGTREGGRERKCEQTIEMKDSMPQLLGLT